MRNYYQYHIKQSSERLQKHTQAGIYYSILRLVLFVSVLVAAYYLIKHTTILTVCLESLILFVFIAIMKISDKNEQAIKYYQSLKKVHEQELDCILYDHYPNANGSEFNDTNHPYSNDLDIFGNHSIFHLLNRCHTYSGYSYLAKQLKYPPENPQDIYRRQEVIRELQTNEKDFIFHLLALLISNEKQQTSQKDNIHLWLQQSDKLKLSKIIFWFIHIVPFLNFILLCITFAHPNFFPALLFFILFQGGILNRYGKSIDLIKRDLNTIIQDISDFAIYVKAFKKARFQSPLLQDFQQQIIIHDQAIQRLYSLLSTFDMSDSFMGFFGNILFFNHIKAAVKLEKWKQTYHEVLPQSIGYICEWETWVSLTIFSMNNPMFVFPSILDNESSIMLDATNLGHPLLNEDKRITNNLILSKNNFLIITGANMAGKSTFLRTIGINMVLARIGAPVCATSFQCIPVSLFTSMRTIDNLNQGISYFYAEALRIKQMVTFMESGKNVLLIVDELFRGTNSDDRLKSSLSFIKRLTQYYNISALIATHDLGITVLEEDYPEIIKNYCFECSNHQEQIMFDYKLKSGITISYNAYQLLQQMNIVD